MPINRCYWAPGDDQSIWDINYALIGRVVEGASVARGLAKFRRDPPLGEPCAAVARLAHHPAAPRVTPPVGNTCC